MWYCMVWCGLNPRCAWVELDIVIDDNHIPAGHSRSGVTQRGSKRRGLMAAGTAERGGDTYWHDFIATSNPYSWLWIFCEQCHD